jgi:8-oxo-dGTP pyrophosphatase MutT (NUDIX family)
MSVENKTGKPHVTSCGAIVVEDFDDIKYILLIKQFKHSDTWGIPKGHIEPHETQTECALREVKEETGITINVGEKIEEITFNLGEKVKKVIAFRGAVVDKQTSKAINLDHSSNEVADARWFNVKCLPKLVAYQSHMIRKYLETLDI